MVFYKCRKQDVSGGHGRKTPVVDVTRYLPWRTPASRGLTTPSKARSRLRAKEPGGGPDGTAYRRYPLGPGRGHCRRCPVLFPVRDRRWDM